MHTHTNKIMEFVFGYRTVQQWKKFMNIDSKEPIRKPLKIWCKYVTFKLPGRTVEFFFSYKIRFVPSRYIIWGHQYENLYFLKCNKSTKFWKMHINNIGCYATKCLLKNSYNNLLNLYMIMQTFLKNEYCKSIKSMRLKNIYVYIF